jgi:hypothetical protein
VHADNDRAPDSGAFAEAIGLDASLADIVYHRVIEKLHCEPVEDMRIDFEDGYGIRSDEEEDEHAVQTANEVVRGMEAGTLPPFIGIRIKDLSGESCVRSMRTLDLFLTALDQRSRGALPANFVVTLPKVTGVEQVEVLCTLFEEFESRLGFSDSKVVASES